MAKEWQIKQGEKLLGPFTDAQLQKLVSSGRINRRTPIRGDENSIWMVAGRIPGLFFDEESSGQNQPPWEMNPTPRPISDSEEIWEYADAKDESGSDSEKVWHVARDGKTQGPITLESLKNAVSLGNVRPTDLVWCEGMADWKPASSVRGLLPTDSTYQRPAAVKNAAGEKFCYECGAAIRRKAEICPKCGVRQPSDPNQTRNIESGERERRRLLTTPVLISAIGNIAFSLFWLGTVCGIPLGIGMIVVCIFEFIYYSESDRISPEEMIRKAGPLAAWEIVCGLFNLVSFICGIVLLINKGKYQRSHASNSMQSGK